MPNNDIPRIRREFQRTNEKTHWEIITKILNNSKFIYCLSGFEHGEIMEKLGVNHLIFYDKNSFTHISSAKNKEILNSLKDKIIIFLTSNDMEYLSFIKAFLGFKKVYKKIYGFDIEVLKAVCIIPVEELKQNDYQIGLTVGGNGSLKALFDEVKRELGFNDIEAYNLINEALKIEEKRIIKGKMGK